jgi:long-chain fatty acid transport protein
MKKLYFVLALVAAFNNVNLFAGDDQTNTNLSASYIRNPSRDASTDLDAVFYNPAGLTKLKEGLSISLSNQYIVQKKDVTSNYPYLRGAPNAKYSGEVKAPFFPCIYGAYKLDKLVFSIGFNVVGGGGVAKFNKGLPSFEMSISDLVPMLAMLAPTAGVTAYSANINFNGGSNIFGTQAGVSYEINPMISVFGGVRYLIAKNTYTGTIKDIMINPGGGPMMRADAFFNSIPMPDYAAATADKEVDAEQNGTGITPIIGVNLVPVDNLNIGIKYEFATNMELKNKTKKDLVLGVDTSTGVPVPVTLFPDGHKVHSDMAAMLTVGASYKFIQKLTASVGFHIFFDKNVDFGKQNELGQYVNNSVAYDKNYIDIMTGLEYKITDKILISAGYQYSKPGIKDAYQSDKSYYLASSNVGFGGSYAFTPDMIVNVGFMFATYSEFTNTINHELGALTIPVTEKYLNKATLLAIGLDYSFGK